MNDLRVLVIAGDSLARAGLAAVLDREAGFNVVGQVAGEADLSDTREVCKPDVAVWDLGWDPLAALELMADFAGGRPPRSGPSARRDIYSRSVVFGRSGGFCSVIRMPRHSPPH